MFLKFKPRSQHFDWDSFICRYGKWFLHHLLSWPVRTHSMVLLEYPYNNMAILDHITPIYDVSVCSIQTEIEQNRLESLLFIPKILDCYHTNSNSTACDYGFHCDVNKHCICSSNVDFSSWGKLHWNSSQQSSNTNWLDWQEVVWVQKNPHGRFQTDENKLLDNLWKCSTDYPLNLHLQKTLKRYWSIGRAWDFH